MADKRPTITPQPSIDFTMQKAPYLERLTKGWSTADQAYFARAFGFFQRHFAPKMAFFDQDHLLEISLRLAGEVDCDKETVVALWLGHGAPDGALVDQVGHAVGGSIPLLIGKAQALQEAWAPAKKVMCDDRQVAMLFLARGLMALKGADLAAEKEQHWASQVRAFHIPLARRFRCHKLQAALEEEVVKRLDPCLYSKVAAHHHVARSRADLHRIASLLHKVATSLSLKFRLERRRKSIFSTWEKMGLRKCSLEEIYDHLGFRIILEGPFKDEVAACRKVCDGLRKTFVCKGEKCRDWLTKPRPSGYQALHLTLKQREGRWFEVQIRTARMHWIATRGAAAHWKYKEEGKI